MPIHRNDPVLNLEVKTLVSDDRWGRLGLDALARRACLAALQVALPDAGNCEISILACNDEDIRRLNQQHRNRNTPTNVLSFPVSDNWPVNPAEPQFLGDLALSWDTCSREAMTGNRNIESHVCHLLVHGCLHLLGFDHETDTEADKMCNLETVALELLGLNNPYCRRQG